MKLSYGKALSLIMLGMSSIASAMGTKPDPTPFITECHYWCADMPSETYIVRTANTTCYSQTAKLPEGKIPCWLKSTVRVPNPNFSDSYFQHNM